MCGRLSQPLVHDKYPYLGCFQEQKGEFLHASYETKKRLLYQSTCHTKSLQNAKDLNKGMLRSKKEKVIEGSKLCLSVLSIACVTDETKDISGSKLYFHES